MLDTICEPQERNDILYQWKNDPLLLERNRFIGDQYNAFQENRDAFHLVRMMMANYILEGIYFYSGFMFFYNLGRMGKMPGSASEIRYINRDENTHLWLFHNILQRAAERGTAALFPFVSEDLYGHAAHRRGGGMPLGRHVIGSDIEGLNIDMVVDYIRYLGNKRARDLQLGDLFEDNREEPQSMPVGQRLFQRQPDQDGFL